MSRSENEVSAEEAEPNDGETLVLMKMFVPLDPPVPEASIPSGLSSYVNQ